jgi:hypothetical protein
MYHPQAVRGRSGPVSGLTDEESSLSHLFTHRLEAPRLAPLALAGTYCVL